MRRTDDRPAALKNTVLVCVALLGTALTGTGQAQSAKQLLLGVWDATYPDPYTGAPIYERFVFQEGAFNSLTQTAAGGYTYFAGPYKWVSAGLIRLTFQQAEPKQFCGPLGCNAIRYPEGETDLIRFPDRNTMIRRVAACPANVTVGCETTYHRSQ